MIFIDVTCHVDHNSIGAKNQLQFTILTILMSHTFFFLGKHV